MKKNLLYYLFAILCTVPLFISCSDEDNTDTGNDNIENNVDSDDETPSVITIPVDQFVGDYKGVLTVNASGEDEVKTYQNISITKASENSINLLVTNYDYTGFPLGDIELEDVFFYQKDGDTYICQREEQLTLNVPFGTCDIKSFISIQNNAVAIDFDIIVPALENRVVKVAYQGTKLGVDESSEAKILSFTFNKENTVNSIVAKDAVIDEDNKVITFGVWDYATDTQLKALVPTIEVSEGATLKVPEVIDFSQDMIYTVVSQDWGTVNTYIVKAPAKIEESVGEDVLFKYNFNSWGDLSGTLQNIFVNTAKYTWSTPLPIEELATTNDVVAVLMGYMGSKFADDFNVVKEAGYGGSGYAAKLVTLKTQGAASVAQVLTSGALFTGKFEFPNSISSELTKQLEYVNFGIPCNGKPSKLKGVYKYTPGSPFIDGSNKNSVHETNEIDAPAIYAVLYEAKDANGADVILTGKDIKDSPYRVATAELKDGSAKANWTIFEEGFVYEAGKSYNPAKEYKIVIICSSSKEGDYSRGGVGSTLIVDDLEVIGG